MIYVFIVGAVVYLLIGAGRRKSSWSNRQRLARALVAAFAALAAVVAGLRGAWIVSAGLILLSAVVGGSVKMRSDPPSDYSSMSVARARSILGVGPTADRAEIERAYRRLIQRVHPDHGGATGLAAALNAARDVLLK